MDRETQQRVQKANARLLLRILWREALYVAPLTCLLLVLITKNLPVSLGISSAIFAIGMAGYHYFKRRFTQQGLLDDAGPNSSASSHES
ncbi:MAG: hypothetical protein K2Q12_05475 [Rickettsiales bacterium]|nr:hypothetical protein [Rickettsiales bacterium]